MMQGEPERVETRACVVGGGPAGMMCGFLLARAGVPVVVLEKHADFFRDFRGDTIHPSTLELMYELGLLDRFLQLPHQEVREIGAWVGQSFMRVGDLTRLPTHCKFLAFMPQWDFLDFVAREARAYPAFSLRMQADADELIFDGERIAGVRAALPNGRLEVRATLVIGADGRHSVVRPAAGLEVENFGVPMDVLWFRVPRAPSDPGQVLGRVDRGKMLIMLDRGDYFQCGYLIRKGAFDEILQAGLPAFRDDIATLAPFLKDRLDAVAQWGDVRLLTVMIDRLRRWWRPGLLCIGDAAHAMSPIGGVGINLAVQDAVATANILWRALRDGSAPPALLERVQRRREFPTRVTQAIQVMIQDNVIRRVLGIDRPLSPPWPLRLLNRFRVLRGIPARLVGIGVRPEHVQTPDVDAKPPQ